MNLLNFMLTAALMSLMLYYTFIEKERLNEDDILAIVVLSFTFLFIVAPFNWLCYALHKTYKLNQQLSKKIKVLGLICSILFSLLTVVEMIGAIDLVTKISSDKIYDTIGFISFFVGFCLITLTSLYLSISYWFVRRQTKIQFVDIVAELGDQLNS